MRAIPTLKISISGVRGVVGASLTPSLLTRFAQAFGTYVGGGRIIVGRDTRTSGEMVSQAVTAGLLSAGCRILDLGVCPTPTVQLVVRRFGARGGVAVTASHNPAEWNALKFIGADGLFLGGASGRELLDIYHQGDYTRVGGDAMRSVERREDALDLHVAAVIDALGPLPPTARRPRVALDACNGAGSVVSPRLLAALGADVVGINVTPDGRFPRPAEPTPAALAQLSAAVREHGCDLGFAQDMDADRLAVVDETGRAIGEDLTLLLACQRVLSVTPGPVVTNVATTHALEAVAAAYGCLVTRSPVGEANVTEAMRRVGAVIGGEGNGGVIYPRINFARDSLVGMALILHRLAADGRPLSAIVAEIPALVMVKRQFACASHRIGDVLRAARAAYAGLPADTRDGLKVTLPAGWFLLRGSNTEPIVRLIAEARTEADATALADDLYQKVIHACRG
ncbi:MAG: phosphoglucosamine mutase [Vicinamibacterales bacterium]|nr:phosphoglucosamine mutase [Vicinamibacterales bacterium]